MKSKALNYLRLYQEQYTSLTKIDNQLRNKFLEIYKLFLKVKKNNNKILIFGNGGVPQ